MSEEIDKLESFLDELDAAGVERLVVRWIDETRPVPENESGYTVGRVTRVTFTAQRDGEVVRQTFEGVGYDELRQMVARYPFETLYRSDNVTR